MLYSNSSRKFWVYSRRLPCSEVPRIILEVPESDSVFRRKSLNSVCRPIHPPSRPYCLDPFRNPPSPWRIQPWADDSNQVVAAAMATKEGARGTGWWGEEGLAHHNRRRCHGYQGGQVLFWIIINHGDLWILSCLLIKFESQIPSH
jgi:hypothetical protein